MPQTPLDDHDRDPDDDLAPDIRCFQQQLAAAYAAQPPLASVSLAEARRITERVRAPFAEGGPAMVRTDESIVDSGAHGPLRIRIHRPTNAGILPALVYLHGGGWVFFSIDTHDRLMREIAMRSGRVVIGVDYARAPEARFPVALEQTTAAWRWAQAHAVTWGLDPAHIALGGDSAGANLALAAAVTLREAGAAPDAMLLAYGCFSNADDTASFARFDGPRYTLGQSEMRDFWRHYLGGDAVNRIDPRAVPLHADLRGLPRCCLVVADCDVLRDSSLALAAAGVPHEVQRHAGATHSFLEAMSFSTTAQRALDQSCAWLREEPAR